jgi:hypothetical protein
MAAIIRTSVWRRVIAPAIRHAFLSGLVNDPMAAAMGAPVDDIVED